MSILAPSSCFCNTFPIGASVSKPRRSAPAKSPAITLKGVLVDPGLVVAVLTDGRRQRLVDVTDCGSLTSNDLRRLWRESFAATRRRQVASKELVR